MNIEKTIKLLISVRYNMNESHHQLCKEALEYCKENKMHEEMIKLCSIEATGYSSVGDIEGVIRCNKNIEDIKNTYQEDLKVQCLANYSLGLYNWNFSRYELALDLFLKALELETDLEKIARVKHKIAVTYLKLNNYSKALFYFEDIYEHIHDIHDDFLKQDFLGWYSIFYSEIGNFEKSVEFAHKAVIINLKISNFNGLSSNYNTLGLNYKSMGYYDQAMHYFIEAEKNALILNTAILLANVYNNIALVYNNLENYEKAIEYNEKSIVYRKQCMGLDQLSITYRNIIPLYINVNKLQKAKELLLEMEELCQKIQTEKGKVHYLISKSYIALHEKDWDTALTSLDSALAIAEKTDNLTFTSSIYHQFSEVYENKQDYKLAYEYLKLLHSTELKIRKQEDIKLTENLTIQHQALLDKYDLNNRIKEEKIKAVLALSVTANHEINQPLMLIQGNIDLLKDSIPDLSEKQQRFFDKIDKGISKISSTLTNFTHKTKISFEKYLDNIEMVKFDD